ncbi:MAG: DMT family transporter [Inquilinaceae bacterium]
MKRRTIHTAMTPLEWGLMLTLSILWGGSFFFVGVAVESLPPFTIVALRVGLAALALHLVLRIMGVALPRDGRVWMAFLGMGVLNNLIPFSLIVWGQTQIASGLASILNATTPLFGVLVAHALTADEKLSPARLIGIVAGLAGVTVLIGPELLAGLGDRVLAQVAILAAALSYAFAGTFGRRFKRMGVPPLATATGQVTASAILLAPVALIVDRPWDLAMPGPDVWASLLGLAILSTALAYILYFRILETAGATNLLLVTFLIPVSAILLGALFLGERLAPAHLLGMLLIGLGLAAIDGRLPAWLRTRARRPVAGSEPRP